MKALLDFNDTLSLRPFLQDDRIRGMFDWQYNVYQFQKRYNQDVLKLRENLLQCFCVDLGILKVATNLVGSDKMVMSIHSPICHYDPYFRDIMKEKDLMIDENYLYTCPIETKKYKGKIPKNILNKLYNIENVFNNIEFETYVSDAVKMPDPVMLIQIKKDRNKTFVVGCWE